MPQAGKEVKKLIKAGWLIDGTGGPVQQDVLLRIYGDTVVSVTAGHPEKGFGESFLDFTTCTVVPGLVDAHVHLALPDTERGRDGRRPIETGFEEVARMIERRLKGCLACGVVAVRDAGDRAGHVLRYRNDRLNRSGIQVRLCATGPALHARGRYGRLIGRAVDQGIAPAEVIRRECVDADHVKIINSGLNSLTCFGKETAPQFDLEDLAAAARTAKAGRLGTMVHANGTAPVRDAVKAGCDSIEHGFFMGRENLGLMAAYGTAWVPTACTMSACAQVLPPGSEESAGARRNLDHQMRQIMAARRAGVTIVLGTDSGSPGVLHGRSAAVEVGIFLKAGMTPQEAVRCATWNGAALLGLENWTGMLVPGMPATFVVTRGGPDHLPTGLEKPLAVYVQGIRQVPC